MVMGAGASHRATEQQRAPHKRPGIQVGRHRGSWVARSLALSRDLHLDAAPRLPAHVLICDGIYADSVCRLAQPVFVEIPAVDQAECLFLLKASRNGAGGMLRRPARGCFTPFRQVLRGALARTEGNVASLVSHLKPHRPPGAVGIDTPAIGYDFHQEETSPALRKDVRANLRDGFTALVYDISVYEVIAVSQCEGNSAPIPRVGVDHSVGDKLGNKQSHIRQGWVIDTELLPDPLARSGYRLRGADQVGNT